MTSTTRGLLGLVLLLSPLSGAFPADGVPPSWFAEHIRHMARDGGRWITDNSEFKSDGEPFDAYGTEWALGIGGKSLTGRLFGLREGNEAGTFWEFRTIWHPGEKKAYVYQYGGDGTVGIGTMEPVEGDRTRSEQTFFRPDGSSHRVVHEMWFSHGGRRHHTRSFDVREDGSLRQRRLYVWKLES